MGTGNRRNLGCVPYAQSWVFFQNIQNTACKTAKAMVFRRGDIGYPAVCFEYKTAFERYLVPEI